MKTPLWGLPAYGATVFSGLGARSQYAGVAVALDHLSAADGHPALAGHGADFVAPRLKLPRDIWVQAFLNYHLVVTHHETQGIDGLLGSPVPSEGGVLFRPITVRSSGRADRHRSTADSPQTKRAGQNGDSHPDAARSCKG